MRRTALLVAAVSLLVAVGAPASADDGTTSAKVTRSTAADVGEYPGQVALVFPGGSLPDAQFCGGVQILPEWVLTAGHCVAEDGGSPVSLPEVLIGTTRLDGSGARVPTVQGFVHPGFDFPANDIALLRLAQPIAAPLAPLSFPGQEVLELPFFPGVVTGWGGLNGNEGAQDFPIDLQEGSTPVISDSECQARLDAYGDDLPIGFEPMIVCAGDGAFGQPEQADACRGDSGGPLWARSSDNRLRQIGIVSGGPTCGFSPTYYTSVQFFMDFIEASVGQQLASFPDIPLNSLERDIERIVVFGITAGTGAGLYEPAGNVTRGQMATFLARALGLTPLATGPFSDVSGAGTHDRNINAVANAGIAGGFSDGTYRPELPVTRAQMATFIARALDLQPVADGPFTDLAGFEAHAGNINAIAAIGITLVPADRLYRPGNPVTRAQMAACLSRALLAD